MDAGPSSSVVIGSGTSVDGAGSVTGLVAVIDVDETVSPGGDVSGAATSSDAEHAVNTTRAATTPVGHRVPIP
jgi:hypothetical protein